MKLEHRALLRIRPAFVASFLKKLLRVRRRVVQTEDGKFFIDPVSIFASGLLSKDGYEPDMVNTLRSILRVGDTFLDIGANEGYFSIMAAQIVGLSGTVISVEPQTRLQSVLFRNILENSAYNVNIFQRVISDSIGVGTLSLAPDVNTGSSGLFRATKYAVPTELVPQTTLTQFLHLLRVDRIRLMKVDVEGFEHEVVLGSREVFANGLIENLALELHPAVLKRRCKLESDILDFLSASGYRRNTNHRNLVFTLR
ncbi:MAG: FkbM family methyltransferase [Verrucomicrobia bacterium]|nr:FkbM family methyltransferase [Verrucomicrobiota bacterium]